MPVEARTERSYGLTKIATRTTTTANVASVSQKDRLGQRRISDGTPSSVPADQKLNGETIAADATRVSRHERPNRTIVAWRCSKPMRGGVPCVEGS